MSNRLSDCWGGSCRLALPGRAACAPDGEAFQHGPARSPRPPARALPLPREQTESRRFPSAPVDLPKGRRHRGRLTSARSYQPDVWSSSADAYIQRRCGQPATYCGLNQHLRIQRSGRFKSINVSNPAKHTLSGAQALGLLIATQPPKMFNSLKRRLCE